MGDLPDEIILKGKRNDSEAASGSITFIGTATVLIRVAGFTILTDPNFVHMHEEVYLGNGLSDKRLTNPAMDIKDLPPLDLIVLSHFHGDHFDQVAERDLKKDLPFVTTHDATSKLTDRKFTNVLPLRTWEGLTFRKNNSTLRVTSMPGRHGPPVVSFILPEVMGTMLEFDSDHQDQPFRIYITGDTVMMEDIKEISDRYPEIDLALLHLGGTQVLGIRITMDDKEGIEMIQQVQPKLSIPIHYNDYTVFKSPLSDFQLAVKKADLENRVYYLVHGDRYNFDLASAHHRPPSVAKSFPILSFLL